MTHEDGNTTQPTGSRRWFVFVPVLIFLGLAGLFAKGLLTSDPSKIPTALKDRPAPEFTLPPLAGIKIGNAEVPGLSSADLRAGTVTLVNVWASWCGPCRQEHPILMQLAKDPTITVVGINYKDKPANARKFLASLGNPYVRIGADEKGVSAIDWGVYGVPETFVIDGKGIIRHKLIGPITPKGLEGELLPAIAAAKQK
jgi:cytochrome c biogenesis protein CcmG/thiol:disulfide interchange protein DsbE